jgi:pimeloyl-ACP methyl ester carboxylesterase
MLHGLFVGSLASWYFTSAPALARDRRVFLFDLRGHGKSERARTGYDVATMSADLGALADGFEQGPIDLVGHSFGALVALRLAIDHPERVRRIVLVEAPLPPSRFEELDAFGTRSPEQMVESLPMMLRTMVANGGRKGARLVDALRFLATGSTLLDDLRKEPDFSDETLASLKAPALVAYGDRSSCRPVGDRLARTIPNARLEILRGGHYLHLEAGARLTELMVEHFDG